MPDNIPDEAPQFMKNYFVYYKRKRGYHKRSLNSNGGWNKTSALSFLNTYKKLTGGNKELQIVPDANHTDLYNNFGKIPFDKIEAFYREYLK